MQASLEHFPVDQPLLAASTSLSRHLRSIAAQRSAHPTRYGAAVRLEGQLSIVPDRGRHWGRSSSRGSPARRPNARQRAVAGEHLRMTVIDLSARNAEADSTCRKML
jgi:hypothetical protein